MPVKSIRLAIGCLLLSFAPSALAVDDAPASAFRYQWKLHQCDAADSGYISRGVIRTEVLEVPSSHKEYYQRVDIRIDKLVGYSDQDPTWRKVDGRNWNWSKFTERDLPTYSTSGVRTGLQPDDGELSVKATVTLRQTRYGLPDRNVWRYARRSPTFRCIDNSIQAGGRAVPRGGFALDRQRSGPLVTPSPVAHPSSLPRIFTRMVSCTRGVTEGGGADFIIRILARTPKRIPGRPKPVLRPLAGATVIGEMTGETTVVDGEDVRKTDSKGIAKITLTFKGRGTDEEDLFFMGWRSRKTGYQADRGDSSFLQGNVPVGSSCKQA